MIILILIIFCLTCYIINLFLIFVLSYTFTTADTPPVTVLPEEVDFEASLDVMRILSVYLTFIKSLLLELGTVGINHDVTGAIRSGYLEL